jgi:hypothetical protein
MLLKKCSRIFVIFCLSGYGKGQANPVVPAEVATSHFAVTVDGQTVPVLHAALNLYFLNFEAQPDALITVTSDQDSFWADGAEVQPWRLNIRPLRTGRTLTFHLKGAEKITLTRPGDFGSHAEMLYLFANPKEVNPPTATTAGVRYFGPGIHRENIDAATGDHIYLADGAILLGSLNIWQVDRVSVSGRGVILYDGPQNPADDDGWMHKKNWHCIVMDEAHDISIEGITCVVRSRTWQVQMKDSRNILFDNVKVIGANEANANADGMDWLGGGDTVVRDSFIRAADDVFALQTSWDGYGPEAFSHQGQPVTNILIERGVFSTSISNIVRAGWPEKNFQGGQFTMRDADVIHAGMGGCGVPFALMELWADPNGRGQSSNFAFENIRLEDWYSLVQLRQPSDGVRNVSFRGVTGLESPALIPSTIKGAVHEVTFDHAGNEAGTPAVEVLDGAQQPILFDSGPQAKIIVRAGWIRPGQRVHFHADTSGPQSSSNRYHWLFGDGSEALGSSVSHRFTDTDGTLLDGTGRYRVLLEVTSAAGRHAWGYAPVIVEDGLQPRIRKMPGHPGLTYRYRETALGAPDESTGTATHVSLASIPHGQNDYSIGFDGFLRVPADGGYTFFMVANEAATILIDGKTLAVSKAPIEQVCGLAGRAAQAISGSAALQKGFHTIQVSQAHTVGKDDFKVLWRGPGFSLQPISADALSH